MQRLYDDYRRLGGLIRLRTPTGKSFRFVRACVLLSGHVFVFLLLLLLLGVPRPEDQCDEQTKNKTKKSSCSSSASRVPKIRATSRN